jgi:predicted nucleic acid-binding protein
MKYVLDASAALAWVLPNVYSAQALRLRDESRRKIHALLAPSIFPGEIASGLTKAERQKLIPVGEARRLLGKVFGTAPALFPYRRLLYRATDISSQTRSAFYDCLYVALAEQENCEFVTADDKLVRNVQTQFPFVRSLASMP